MRPGRAFELTASSIADRRSGHRGDRKSDERRRVRRRENRRRVLCRSVVGPVGDIGSALRVCSLHRGQPWQSRCSRWRYGCQERPWEEAGVEQERRTVGYRRRILVRRTWVVWRAAKCTQDVRECSLVAGREQDSEAGRSDQRDRRGRRDRGAGREKKDNRCLRAASGGATALI